MKNTLIFFALICSCYSCNSSYGAEQNDQTNEITTEEEKIPIPKYERVPDRKQIIKNLTQKVTSNEPLTVHIFVPLCDNINQGIVPTSPKLGNGMDLRNNLYWGVRHGMKTIFKNNKKWKIVTSYNPVDTNVLERVIFQRTYSSHTVNLIMDAYRGDKMKECLEDYLNALAENITDTLQIDSLTFPAFGNSDLIVFNGHNGLMDTYTEFEVKKLNIRQKDAIAIACSSEYYFNFRYKDLNAYPLVTTTNNLYPGGFIVEGIVDKWATFSSDELIRQEAGNAYNRVKKCGLKGARNLFWTGWDK